MTRTLIGRLVLLVCGTLLGAIGAYAAARTIQLQMGREDLANYARRLLGESPHLVDESNRAIAVVLGAHLAFCSDEELALIRDYVYNATHVRHIGRIRDGDLYCTSGVGRLARPGPMPLQPLITIDGLNVYQIARLVISHSANDAGGLVVEHFGVSTVTNPNAYRGLDESPKHSSGYLFDPRDSRAFLMFGHSVAVSGTEMAAGEFIERDGIFFQPLCAKGELICVVASETRADVIATRNGFFRGFLVGGMLLGFAVGAIVILLHRRHCTLEQQLRRAIRHGNLSLVYQPIIDLQAGKVVGAEALVRWINEAGKAISPEVFIAVAEKKQFVGEITKLVIQKVVEEMGDVLAAGNLTVTINVSSQDLVSADFFETLERCMRARNLKPDAIGLEVTERSTVDQQTTIDAIDRLKLAGHTVYIDDFGTGYSNLAYLHRLAANAIKIDRVFTKTVGTEAVTASVVPQILDMAKQLGLRVVVEGIETKEQAEYFRRTGIAALAQGFLFSAGIPAAQVKRFFIDSCCDPGEARSLGGFKPLVARVAYQ